MEQASHALDFERAALFRDRLAALSASSRSRASTRAASRRPTCSRSTRTAASAASQVFFFRTGQNWGNRAYFPRPTGARRREVLGAFLAQFYDDKPCPRLILVSHDDRGMRAARGGADAPRAAARSRSRRPSAARRRTLVDHALANAREALGRKLAETASQRKLLRGVADCFGLDAAAAPHRGLRQQPHPGHQCGRRDDRRRSRGFMKNQYRKFNIRSATSRRATISA